MVRHPDKGPHPHIMCNAYHINNFRTYLTGTEGTGGAEEEEWKGNEQHNEQVDGCTFQKQYKAKQKETRIHR